MSDDSKRSMHRGDVLPVLAAMGAGSIDAVITEPPGDNGGRRRQLDVGGASLCGHLAWMSMVLSQCRRVARTGSPLLLVSSGRHVRVNSAALVAAGWTWRGVVTWSQPAGRRLATRARAEHQYVLWGTKGPADIVPGTGSLPGVITVDRSQLWRDLTTVCAPDGTILDPFARSDETGLAALAEGRSFVGIEVEDAGTTRDRPEARVDWQRVVEAGAEPSAERGEVDLCHDDVTPKLFGVVRAGRTASSWPRWSRVRKGHEGRSLEPRLPLLTGRQGRRG